MMLFVLLLISGAVATQSSTERRQYLCGRELAKAHSLYCYGLDPFPKETETVGPIMPKLPEQEDMVVIEDPKIPNRFVYRARRAAEARVNRSALFETCCLKPCLIGELINHC